MTSQRRRPAWLLSLPLLLAATPAALAAPPKETAWQGKLSVGGGVELRIVIHVVPGEGNKFTGTMDSPDQGASGLKLDAVSLDGGKLTFSAKNLGIDYEGKVNAAGDAVEGTFKQGPASFPLNLKKLEGEAPKLVGKEQLWEGVIDAGGAKLRLILHLGKDQKGEYMATLDSPDQGAKGLAVSSVSLDEKTLKFEMKLLKAKFEGTLNKAGDAAEGTWEQGGGKLPVTFKKIEKVSELKRPQTPKPPFPYRSEDVAYENKAGGVKLAGTLTIPEGAGPFPAALLITGSGAQDRDETIFGHKPFFVIADALTRRGIAVLRVDDRGVGGSTGSTGNSTTEDFAGDALAGVTFLKSRPEIDAKKIGFIGHSEGGLIGPLAATKSDDVAFVVMLAGTGLPGEEIMYLQGQAILKAMGADEESLAWQLETQKRLFAIVKAETDPKVVAEKLAAMTKELIAKAPEALKKAADETSLDAMLASAKRVDSPWFRFFLSYDPRPTLAKTHCPVLALIGEKDTQVPARENLAAIESALKDGGNSRSTLKTVPGVNHLFQTCTTGSPNEYSGIEETIAPAALTLIGDWIVEQTRR